MINCSKNSIVKVSCCNKALLKNPDATGSADHILNTMGKLSGPPSSLAQGKLYRE
jgi:hypothetical protein